MKALSKTLFGDGRNIAAVALIVAVAAGLTRLHHPEWAVYAIPPIGLAAVAWLARY